MKKSSFKKGKKPLTSAIQGFHLRKTFPDSEISLHHNHGLTWVGKLQPSPLSSIYTVKLKYRLKKRPEVTVIEPQLSSHNGEQLPHIFSGDQLCLFRYKYFEWDSSMRIDETIVPWISLWLLYYEIWTATGKWCGSNQEHSEKGNGKII